MKRERLDYLFVSPEDINVSLWALQKEKNPFKSVYRKIENVYDAVPTDGMIIRLFIPKLFVRNEAEEYMTGFPFDITGMNQREIVSKSLLTLYGDRLITEYDNNYKLTYMVKVPMNFISKDEAMEFYDGIRKEKRMVSYSNDINTLFRGKMLR